MEYNKQKYTRNRNASDAGDVLFGASSCFMARNDCKPSPLISFDYLYGGFAAIWAAGQHSINKRFHFSFILTVATWTNWKKKEQKPKDIQYYWN